MKLSRVYEKEKKTIVIEEPTYFYVVGYYTGFDEEEIELLSNTFPTFTQAKSFCIQEAHRYTNYVLYIYKQSLGTLAEIVQK